MNRGRFIGGIICVAVAGFLAVLNFRLPPEDLMFTVGDQNMPWVPVAILGVVGVLLLVTSLRGPVESATEPKPEIVLDESKAALNKRLETLGWGFFLIMLGGFAFVPYEMINKGIWSIGVGVIMLGLNAARYVNDIRMSGFTTALGIISLVSGTLQVLGWNMYEGGLLLIILGAYVLLKPWFDKQQLFGKAEEA